tara:strand:+ start:6855 stop:9977 length:3123 start_codon:yes stop_codon:yes gene_type:complete
MPLPQRIQVQPYQAIYGQVVGEFRNLTVKSAKYSNEGNPATISERYKVRIFGRTRPGEADSNLPTAKIRSVTSGLGARTFGLEPILAPNTFVELEQDNGGNWWIVNTLKNVPETLKKLSFKEGEPSSGFPPGSTVPQTHVNPGGSGTVPERPGAVEPSKEGEKQNSENKTENLLTACKKVNVDAVNSEIQKLIQDVENIRTGLLGEDSFLQTSLTAVNDFQDDINEKINNASKNIAQWTAWLVQEIRRFVLRKVNGSVNNLMGNAPLSTRFYVNFAKKNALNTISCIFVRLLANIEKLIGNALKAIVDKLINTATCLVEGFVSQFVGQIINQVQGLINGALGELSSLLGSVISFTTEIIDFVISILDFLKCKPENICPQTEKWNPLEGGEPEVLDLDFGRIFESARGIVNQVEGLVDFGDDIENVVDNFEFLFDSGGVIQNLINGCNQFTGPQLCGPPNVVFWGGSGSGAAGNAVINAVGDIVGVDLTSFGDYTEAPFISLQDNCGNGVGGVLVPIPGYYLGPFDPDDDDDTDPQPTELPEPPDGEGGTVDPPPPPPGDPEDPVPPPPLPPVSVPPPGPPDDVTDPPDDPPPPFPPRPIRLPGPEVPPDLVIPPGIDPTPRTGIVDVIVTDPGYGYLPTPDGSTGGGGREWADRCQTAVQRANGDYDTPYSEGDVIRLYFGDSITLPAQPRITIDCDFTIDDIPGAIEVGEKYCFKDMTGFDEGNIYVNPIQIRSMVGFDDTRGSRPEVTPPISIEHQNLVRSLAQTERAQELFALEREALERGEIFDFGRPDQFGFTNDYPYAKELGFSDTDIRFYIEGFYSRLLGKRVGPLMQLKLEDPNFGPIPRTAYFPSGIGIFDCENDYRRAIELGFNDMDIRYYLENIYTGQLDECMEGKLADPTWGRAPEYYVSVTAPGCPDFEDPEDAYTTIPIIGDIGIINPGFGYSPEDTAIVLNCSGEGESSTVVEIDVDNNGRIVNARVVQTGTSFACIPEIVINTSTGHNAVLQPIMRFEQPIAGGLDAEEFDGEVIQVINCVGKV